MLNKFISVAATTVSVANAWSTNGHLISANIAQNVLEETAPDSLTQANLMLSYLHDFNETLCYHEGNHTFVEVATFADDVKYHGHAW